MQVANATKNDLQAILAWLKQEHDEREEGFWSNASMIEDALGERLWVIRHNGEAVAFQVGNYSPLILCLCQVMQRRGLGTALFNASLERAKKDNVNALWGECAPPESESFWSHHGFERYEDPHISFGKILVRRVLTRSFELPPHLPRQEITISFYPDSARYSPQPVDPIAVHQVQGAQIADRIQLQQRVIVLTGPGNQIDVAAKVVIGKNSSTGTAEPSPVRPGNAGLEGISMQ